MYFSLNLVLHTHESETTMDPEQFSQFNPQGPPQNRQAHWQQPNMQPFPPGPQNAQPPMSGPQHPTSGLPMPQPQQPSGLQSPRPGHPQGPPAFATPSTPQLNGTYSPPSQQFAQAPSQQGPPTFPFPLADQQMMSPGPQRFVGTLGQVPPGAIPQPQRAQRGTPGSFGGPPSQHHSPRPSQVPLPPNVQPQRQAPFGNMPMPMGPVHPNGLAQHPLHRGEPPMAPTMAQHPVHGGPPMPPPGLPSVHQSVHGRSPFPPPAQTGPPAGTPAPFVHSVQAAGASAQQAHAMQNRGSEMSHDHIEAYNDRILDLRVKEVMDMTAKHQPNYVDPSVDELDRVLKESLQTYDAHQMENFAKEREAIQAAVLGNLSQNGGGANRRAGSAALRAKRDSLNSSKEFQRDPASNDSPDDNPPRALSSSAPSKHEQTQTPAASETPDQETANFAREQQLAASDVNLERSRSPARSHSRPRRHHRRRDAEWERWSSRHLDGAERWRCAGMYYSSGAYKGDISDNARVRHKRRGSQP